MLLRSVLLATLIALPSAFAATTPLTLNDQLTACSAEPSNDKRLACYDGVAKQTQTPALPNSAPPAAAERERGSAQSAPNTNDIHGHWTTVVQVDAMTDAKTVSFENSALSEQSDNAGEAAIALFCLNKRINFGWSSQAYLGSYEARTPNASYRIDGQQPHSERWQTSKTVAFPTDPVPIVQALTDAKRLVVQVRGFDYESHQAVFDLDGIKEVLSGLSDCWPPAPSPPSPSPTTGSAGKSQTAPASAAARHRSH